MSLNVTTAIPGPSCASASPRAVDFQGASSPLSAGNPCWGLRGGLNSSLRSRWDVPSPSTASQGDQIARVTPWLRGFNPRGCTGPAGSEFPTLQGLLSRGAAPGGFCSARRARPYVFALLGKCLPPREGLHASLGFGGRALLAQSAAGVSPVPSRGTGSATVGAALGPGRAWLSPRRCPGPSPFSRALQKGLLPLAGGTLPRLAAPRAGRAPEMWE